MVVICGKVSASDVEHWLGTMRDTVEWDGEVSGREMARDGRILYVQNTSLLFCTLHMVRVVKSRRMRWAGHVARMVGRGVCTGF